jgi:hypothetical protein
VEAGVSWHPTLSSIERKTDLPQDRPRPLTDTQRREAKLKSIGTWDCWCGLERFHDWPGKGDGKPHPRQRAEAA